MLGFLGLLTYVGAAIADSAKIDTWHSDARMRAIQNGDDYYIGDKAKMYAVDNGAELVFDPATQMLVGNKKFHKPVDPAKRLIMASVNAAVADGHRYVNIVCGLRGTFLYDITERNESNPYGKMISSEFVCYYPKYDNGKMIYPGVYWNDPKELLPSKMTMRNLSSARYDAKKEGWKFVNVYFHELEKYLTVTFFEDGSYGIVGKNGIAFGGSHYRCGTRELFNKFGTDGKDASMLFIYHKR